MGGGTTTVWDGGGVGSVGEGLCDCRGCVCLTLVVDAFVLLLSCALVGEIGECYLRDQRVLYGNHYCFNKKWRKEQWGLRLSQSFLHDVISHYLSDRP